MEIRWSAGRIDIQGISRAAIPLITHSLECAETAGNGAPDIPARDHRLGNRRSAIQVVVARQADAPQVRPHKPRGPFTRGASPQYRTEDVVMRGERRAIGIQGYVHVIKRVIVDLTVGAVLGGD